MATPNLQSITTVTPKILGTGQMASGDNTVYTVPGSKAAKLATLSIANASALVSPVQSAAVGSTTGGTLAAATYSYVITATSANGETLRSNEVSVTTTGATSSVALSWAAVTGASGYKVYRGTAVATENVLVTTIGSGATVTFTDTGAATTAFSPPTTNSTAVAVVVAVSIVPSGGSVDGTHKIVAGYSLATGDSLVCSEDVRGMWLGDGDKVSVNASVGAALDATLTGLEFA